ncbi:nucleotidyltransferase family protein [Brachybacterium sp. EF45031]|uniref:nucleotidyltransferase family protein n=1 Tax=Brachybacterium sillae TaxID=2810536 RepID=UPI00217CDFAA|nr:nucleotidyltransferase family protein [Brachybacterium sillae]MCS6711616.1 nucleotidyltransferase family protein [Brachybacterium sillae]
MPRDVHIPTGVRLRLTHALLEHLAQEAGVRVLHVKGEALDPVLARGRGTSSDNDLLVDPAGVPAMIEVLTRHGWTLMTQFAFGSVFAHAATYYHPSWGTVDLHRSYPGLDRDPVATFEWMWEHREQRELGGVACAVPDLTGQRLILLTHAARDALGRRPHDVRVAWEELTPAERAELDDIADRLGARVPMAYATGRPERAAGRPGEHTWLALMREENPTLMWIAQLRDARGLRGRASVLAAAMHPNPDRLAISLGRKPTPQELRRESVVRWGRAARRLSSVARARWAQQIPGRGSSRRS